MLTARLPLALETQLNHFAATNGLTKSFVVQEAVQDYLQRHKAQLPPLKEAASQTPAQPVDRLQALARELARKYPGPDIDWRDARDEGRK